MDVFSCAYYFALFALPIVLHIVLTKNKKGVYSPKVWYTIIKQWIARPTIKQLQRETNKRISELTDEQLETPRIFGKPEKDNDTNLIYGIDETGNSVIIRLILRQHSYAEVSFQLRLKNGKIYQLPNEPKVLLCSTDPTKWIAEGLTITVLQPFSRLRITYNGLLRDTVRCSCEEDRGTVEHVKFNFIWNAGSSPIHYPQDYSLELLTESLAREQWKDDEWIKLMGDMQSYEQYGALQGFIKGASFVDEEFVYLKSWRKRYWGKADCFTVRRNFSMFVADDDGTLFNAGVVSLRGGCKHLKNGTVKFSNGNVRSLDDSDINLNYLGENEVIPDTFTVNVESQNKSLKCVVHVNKDSIVTTYNDEPKGWKIITAQAECFVNTCSGKGLLTFWYPYQGSSNQKPQPLLRTEELVRRSVPLVVLLEETESRVLSYSGGKGCSLGLLISIKTNEFTVPDGFVITTESFKMQLKRKPHLKQSIEKLVEVANGKQKGDLQNICETSTVNLISSETVDGEIREAILKAVGSVSNGESCKWAVRSSGSSEDSEDLSAAGQNSTFLGCCSDEEVLKSVVACWGSLYSFQSVQYRRQYGLGIDSEMGVVVQKMVPSETAGVLFTCHPTTHDASRMVITANFGLGETVVSGEVDPDTVILSRTWDGDVKVVSKQIGQKETILDADGKKTVGKETSELCISEEQAIKLGKVGFMLEKLFGGPRDIEWAFFKNDLYLLQARPITTINNYTEYELLHEMDTPIFSKDTMNTRANVGEVFPGATTVLSQSVVVKCLDSALETIALYSKCSPYYLRAINIVEHVVHMETISLMYAHLSEKITLEEKLIDIGIYGHVIVDEKIRKTATGRFGSAKPLQKAKIIKDTFKLMWNLEKIAKAAVKVCQEINISFSETESLREHYLEIEKSLEKYKTMTLLHSRSTRAGVSYQVIVMTILAEGADDLTQEHYADIAMLLSSCEGVVSAGVPHDLENITKTIIESNLSEEFTKIAPEDALKWLETKSPNIKQAFDRFLLNHGHRNLKEFELQEESWGMKPAAVIEMIQRNCGAPLSAKKTDRESLETTITNLKTPKKQMTRWILKFFMKKARRAVGFREQSKSELIRAGHKLRLAFNKLGEEMVSEGILPRKELVFHLTFYELGQLIQKPDPILVIKATSRKRYFSKWDKRNFPEISYGFPQPEEESDLMLYVSKGSGVKLTGTPVCPGNVVGRACVLKSLHDIHELRTGDILITNSTDIGWSPYFPILSGVVTELGGLISHGAVVAREYGLPCVVAIKQATKYFKTGDTVLLSGNSGFLELISQENQ